MRQARTLSLVLVLMILFTSGYEFFKQMLHPDESLWESHAVTILFSSVLATIVAYLILGRYEQLIRRLNRAIEERVRTEEELRESECRYRTLVEQIPAVTYTASVDDPNATLYVSPQSKHLLGYLPEDFMRDSERWGKGLHPEDRERVLSELVQSRETESSFASEYRWIKPDGQVRWFRDQGLLLPSSSGQASVFQGVMFDITAQKQTEQALRRSKELFEKVFSSQMDAILILDASSPPRILDCNPIATHIFGYSKEEMVGRTTAFLHVSEEALVQFRQQVREALLAGQGFFYLPTFRMKRKNGTIFPSEHTVVPFHDEHGNRIGWVGVLRDMTEHKKAEEALRESEAKYRTVFESTGTASFLAEPDAVILLVNSEFEKLSGYSKREIEGKKSWTEFVFGGDRERVEAIHRSRWVDPDAAPRQYEARLVDRSGSVRDVLVTAAFIPGSQRLLTSLLDISARKQAEQALQHSIAELGNLQRITQALLELEDLSRVLQTIAHGIVTHLNYNIALVVRYSEEEGGFTHLAHWPEATWLEDAPVPDLSSGWGEESRKGKIPYTVGVNPLVDRILCGNTVVSRSAGELLDGWVLPSILGDIQGKYGTLSFIGLPMQVKGQTVGMILAGAREAEKGSKEVRSLARVADQAAIAVENARLFSSVRNQRQELRALAVRLEEVEEAERCRLAQELHDQVGQNLTALNINLSILRTHIPPECVAKIGNRLEDSLQLVEDTMERIRDVMAELHPPGLDDYGLPAALRYYVEQFSKRTDLAVALQLEDLSPRPVREVERTLFRIAQEALTNVVRHARATQVVVGLERVGGVLRLSVTDDGQGFETREHRQSESWCRWGVVTMRERAEAIGGYLRLDSAPGQGTRILVEVAR